MPIGALTGHVASALMDLATLHGNNDVIEGYMAGAINASDFLTKLKSVHGIPGANHRLYAGYGFDTDIPLVPSTGVAPAVSELDTSALLDYSIRRYIANTFPIVPPNEGAFLINPDVRMRNLVFERLGMKPTANNNGTGAFLRTHPHSWHNWLHDAPAPNVASPGITGFVDHEVKIWDESEYWDRWLTVPYCSMKIWIPEPCVLVVMASAFGTHNYSTSLIVGTHWQDGVYDYNNDTPASFRLFIDEDGREDRRQFRIDTLYGGSYYTNWKSLNNREVSPTNAPRGEVILLGDTVISHPGYYNISMRYSNRFWYGHVVDPAGANTWNMDDYKGGIGEHVIARWERSAIGAIACFKRSATTDDASTL